MTRRHNLRRLRRNWPYKSVELAKTLSVNIGTIRRWTKEGLAPIERRRPFLFLGSDVGDFLAKKVKKHEPLKPGELLCVRCNGARLPEALMVQLVPRSATTVDFSGACERCGLTMYRRVRVSEIIQKLGPCSIASQDEKVTVCSSRAPVQMSLFGELAQ